MPRGTRIQSDESSPLVSSGNCAAVRRWLGSLQKPHAAPDQIRNLLDSWYTGNLFRALYEIERNGPGASCMARPLLSHPDPDLRARAAAVLGNDETLWADLVPLVSDPAPQVRMATRFALLRSTDVETARRAFLDLLRERNDYLEYADFDQQRLLSTEAAEVLLDQLVETGYAPERFCRAMRAEDLRPLVPRLKAVWSGPKFKTNEKVAALWFVRLSEPTLDQLLVEAIAAECPEDEGSIVVGRLADEILLALLDRPAPLAAPDAIATVLRSAQTAVRAERGLSAHAVLLHWKVPGAVEKFLARLGEVNNHWLADWRGPLPRGLVPLLETVAAREPTRFAELVKELIRPWE